MKLYRVFPYDESAAPNERGGALFVPAGGRNRIDNPDLYHVLYVAAKPEAAIAEAFGRLPIWTSETFVHASGHPYVLAEYAVADDVAFLSLDDVDALKAIGIIRPSSVVTRDRVRTQAWARTIFESGRYQGVSWWSYYGPDWTVVGLWDRSAVRIVDTPKVIASKSTAVQETATAIVRQIAR
jgi:hypothetical protein